MILISLTSTMRTDTITRPQLSWRQRSSRVRTPQDRRCAGDLPRCGIGPQQAPVDHGPGGIQALHAGSLKLGALSGTDRRAQAAVLPETRWCSGVLTFRSRLTHLRPLIPQRDPRLWLPRHRSRVRPARRLACRRGRRRIRRYYGRDGKQLTTCRYVQAHGRQVKWLEVNVPDGGTGVGARHF